MRKYRPPRKFDELPKRKQEFLKRYVETADAVRAYHEAGYKSSPNTIASNCRKLLAELKHHIGPCTQEYLRGTDMTVFGLSVVRKLAEEAESEQVRLNAAKELLSRNLPDAPQEIHVHKTTDALTDQQLKEKIRAIQEQIFLDAKPLNVIPIHGKG